MSFALSIHAPWVRNTIRFVAAVSIPVGLFAAYQLSKINADKDFDKTRKVIDSNQTANTVRVETYELKEVDDNNHVRWELLAKSAATTTGAKKKIDIRDIKVKYYDGPNVKMLVTAPVGKVDEETRFVTLTSDNGHRVRGEGDGGKSVFESSTVELDKNNKFFATGGVIIEWTDSARVTGNEARGKLDKSGLQEVKVCGHTHAVITVK
jgi:hypothetical protein